MKQLLTAAFLADERDILIACNAQAQSLLHRKNVLGQPASRVFSRLKEISFHRTALSDTRMLYLADGNAKLSPFEDAWDQSPSAVALCDGQGTLFYANRAFYGLFPEAFNDCSLSQSPNINDVFSRYHPGFMALSLLQRTKKEVRSRLTAGEQELELLLCPLTSASMPDAIAVFCTRCIKSGDSAAVAPLHVEKAPAATPMPSDSLSSSQPSLPMHSSVMRGIYTLVENLSTKEVTVLLLGKSGTGKSHFAKEIHNRSFRRSRPFVTINCSTIPDTLIESELFGYEKGAFTGALASGKKGLAEAADGGTLFLDEIAEIPLPMQSKLLELIQEKSIKPVGSLTSRHVDVRIVAATNKNLAEMVRLGTFREDLYYRIAVAVITLPPLCERADDIPQLIDAYLSFYNNKHGKKVMFSDEALSLLYRYQWPGNLRELDHLVEFLVLCNEHVVVPSGLPYGILQTQQAPSEGAGSGHSPQPSAAIRPGTYQEQIEALERQLIRQAFEREKSSYKVAAALGLSQSKASRLIRKYCGSHS